MILTADYTNSSIVIIENGTVTMRKIGDGPSHVVLEALHSDHKTLEDKLSYLTKTKDGRILKSSSMFIRGENNAIEAVFSINLDITPMQMAENVLQQLISPISAKMNLKIFRRMSTIYWTNLSNSLSVLWVNRLH